MQYPFNALHDLDHPGGSAIQGNGQELVILPTPQKVNWTDRTLQGTGYQTKHGVYGFSTILFPYRVKVLQADKQNRERDLIFRELLQVLAQVKRCESMIGNAGGF